MNSKNEIKCKDMISCEFVFENGEGVTVTKRDFISFDVNKDIITFSINKMYNRNYYDTYTGWNVLFDRLLKNDITHIILMDKSLTELTIPIEWEDMYSNTNKNQNTYINNLGNLVCEITRWR